MLEEILRSRVILRLEIELPFSRMELAWLFERDLCFGASSLSNGVTARIYSLNRLISSFGTVRLLFYYSSSSSRSSSWIALAIKEKSTNRNNAMISLYQRQMKEIGSNSLSFTNFLWSCGRSGCCLRAILWLVVFVIRIIRWFNNNDWHRRCFGQSFWSACS